MVGPRADKLNRARKGPVFLAPAAGPRIFRVGIPIAPAFVLSETPMRSGAVAACAQSRVQIKGGTP